MKESILIICGATATGKSELGVFAAKNYNGEIVSADSMQIYKDMDIGTAKVSVSEMDGIPHYMIDIVDPRDSFSVAEYQEKAEQYISDISDRKKNAIIVGGTGLYINSLLYDYSFGNQRNDEIRQKYRDLAEQNGNEYLHYLLKKVNPEAGNRLHPNDTVRVIRALELAEIGATPSDDIKSPVRNYKAIAIEPERDVLYQKINKRVDIMFKQGLVDEVNSLIKNGVDFNCQSMKAIGYKEFKQYFDGLASLDSVKEKIKQNSRNYAKRQFTWFRKLPGIIWCKDHNDAKKHIEEYYEN